MSLRSNIDHMAAAQGIVAVAVISPAGPRELRGDTSWGSVLDASFNTLDVTGEASIRLVVGRYTIVVQKEHDETMAVVIATGDAIAKSLRRMIRRMACRVRGPLAVPSQPQLEPSRSEGA